jgi:membrane-associated protease RseP (regulator of RpoE activity)
MANLAVSFILGSPLAKRINPTENSMQVFLAVVLLVMSLVVHEAGHWVMLSRYKIKVQAFWLGLGPVIIRWGKINIGMLPIGAALQLVPGEFEKLNPVEKFMAAIAGPMASAIYGVLLLLPTVLDTAMPGRQGLYLLGQLNLVIAAINMIPMPPLDGFQVYCALREKFGAPLSERSKAIANRLGHGLVYGMGFFVLAKVFLP